VPVLAVCLPNSLGEQFAALLSPQPSVAPSHSLGRHRRRIPERVVFEHVIADLVHGAGYERIATPGCSDRTIRRRLHEWAAPGVAEQSHTLALQAYDKMIGLEWEDLAVAGRITKAAGGGAGAGRSPVNRVKEGTKIRSSLMGAAFPCIWSVPAPIGTMPRCCGPRSGAWSPWTACRRQSRPPGRRPRGQPDGSAAGRTGHRRDDCAEGGARPAPNGVPVGDRAHACVDEWLRRATTLHRAVPDGRGPLPVLGRRAGRGSPTDSTRTAPLSLANSSDYAAPQLVLCHS
jgi:hypothetical protein